MPEPTCAAARPSDAVADRTAAPVSASIAAVAVAAVAVLTWESVRASRPAVADDRVIASEVAITILRAVEDHLADAADALVAADPSGADAALAEADAEAARLDVGPGGRVVLSRLRGRIGAARAAVGGLSPAGDARPAIVTVRDAARAARSLLRRLPLGAAAPLDLIEVGGRTAAAHGPGHRAVFRVVPASCAADAVLTVANTDAAMVAVEPSVEPLGRGRFRLRWGPDVGTARISVSACGDSVTRRALNLGPPGALAAVAPTAPDYASAASGGTLFLRVGTAADASPPLVGGTAPFAFSVSPDLPAGLSIDAATGAITGTATASGPAGAHRVTVRNARGAAWADVAIDVDPALPASVVSLAGGFEIDEVVSGADFPSKFAVAPDGRVFFNELRTGNVRVVGADGVLRAAPFASVPVSGGSEQGLLGVALAPDFGSSGHLFVYATTPAGGGKPVRNRVLRFTATGDVASAGPDVIVDDLPAGDTQNAGVLKFGPDGMLYVTVGDTGDAALAQDDASLAGRVLRYAADGAIPSDGPYTGSPEWARGFRNCFGLAFQPGTGRLFVTENGPNAHDELDFVVAGRNFEWGAAPDQAFGALRGIRLIDWTPVIVPTGAAFHPGPGFGDAYADNLFFGSYDRAQVRRIVLSGIDVDRESTFVQFDELDFVNKPLDVGVGPEGDLWVSTFASIWRIRRN